MIELELGDLSKIESLRLTHLLICMGSVFFFVLIRNQLNSIKKDKNHNSLLFLAGAYLMWFFMDTYRFSGFMEAGASSLVIKMLSAYNNGFFLAALPFFGNPFPKWSWYKQSMKWAMSILVGNIILVMVFALLWQNPNVHSFIDYFDLIYSALTYLLILGALFTQAKHTRQSNKPIVTFALFLMCGLIIIQVLFSPIFKVVNFDVVSVFALVFQFLLILVVICLGFNQLNQIQAEQLAVKYQSALQDRDNRIENLELKLAADKKKERVAGGISLLTDREKEVLRYMELSYAEIGEKLFISRDTVISHKKNIESKLGVSGKINLIDFAKSQEI